jgi:holo-[acyl-carrier protein] synthase
MKNISEVIVASVNAFSSAGYIGNDIVHLGTFKKSFNSGFIHRAFTQNELNYCEQFDDSMIRYASTWAAKEAVYKAVKQTDATIKLWWRSIEILRNKPQGKPEVNIKKIPPNWNISLTITHDGDYVWALALCQVNEARERVLEFGETKSRKYLIF